MPTRAATTWMLHPLWQMSTGAAGHPKRTLSQVRSSAPVTARKLECWFRQSGLAFAIQACPGDRVPSALSDECTLYSQEDPVYLCKAASENCLTFPLLSRLAGVRRRQSLAFTPRRSGVRSLRRLQYLPPGLARAASLCARVRVFVPPVSPISGHTRRPGWLRGRHRRWPVPCRRP